MSIHSLSGPCLRIPAIVVAIGLWSMAGAQGPAAGLAADRSGEASGRTAGPAPRAGNPGTTDRPGDPRLIGAWKPLIYRIQGKDHPMEGLLLFTDRYFSSNVLFQLTGGPVEDANVNAGTYAVTGRQLVFTQWMRLQVRPGDVREPIFLRKGEPEPAEYQIEGERLEIIFPSQNRFILERLPDDSHPGDGRRPDEPQA
jgi:hypothetical protein